MLRFLPKHDKGNIDHIPTCDLLSVSGDGLVEVHGHKSNSIPSMIECLCFDKAKLYQQNVIRIRNDHIDDNNKLVINSNIVSTPTTISRLMSNINASYLEESLGFKVYLPPFYAYLEPGDLINIHYNNMQQVVSITNIASVTGGILEISAVSCNVHTPVEQLSSYGDNIASEGMVLRNSPEYLIEVLDIPNFYNDDTLLPVIYIATAAKSGEFRPVQLEYADNQDDYSYPYSEFISQEAVIGVADCINLSNDISPEIIDHKSVIRVFLISGELYSTSEENMASGHNVNLAIIDNELIQFMIVRKVGDNEFILSGLKRGCLGTEHLTNHQNKQYQRFVLLNEKLHAIELPIHIYQNICKYRVLDTDNEQYKHQKTFVWQANSIKPLAPANLSCELRGSSYYISWQRRNRVRGRWMNHVDVPLDYSEEKYLVTIENIRKEILFSREIQSSHISVGFNELSSPLQVGGKISVQQISPLIGIGESAICHIKH